MLGFKKTTPAPAVTDGELLVAHQPLMLIVGSMEADSRSDVLAYARGIAESQVIAKEACFVDAFKDAGRWIFEIHEGGPGKSIGKWVVDALSANPGSRVSLPLSANRVATVNETSGEIVTIIHPPSEEKHARAADAVASLQLGKDLKPLLGTAEEWKITSMALLGLSTLLFVMGGAALFLKAHAVDIERFSARFASANPSSRTDIKNLPIVQLDNAVKGFSATAGYLSFLKLEKGRWTWAQATAAATAPTQGGAGSE